MRRALALAAASLFFACSSSPSDADAGIIPDAGAIDAGPTFKLTMNNFLDWCTVLENGVDAGTSIRTFPAGTVVQLTSSPNSGFVWGYWIGTDVDGGSTNVSMTTTVTMDKDQNVLACCPFPPPQSQTCP